MELGRLLVLAEYMPSPNGHWCDRFDATPITPEKFEAS